MSEMHSVAASFAQQFSQFKAENSELIAKLVAAAEDYVDELGELLDDIAADLKSSLGADAANGAGADENSQEKAIFEAEIWVTDNVSNSSLDDRIAGVLWYLGTDEGSDRIHEELLVRSVIAA